jgi:hypothetical protein
MHSKSNVILNKIEHLNAYKTAYKMKRSVKYTYRKYYSK